MWLLIFYGIIKWSATGLCPGLRAVHHFINDLDKRIMNFADDTKLGVIDSII